MQMTPVGIFPLDRIERQWGCGRFLAQIGSLVQGGIFGDNCSGRVSPVETSGLPIVTDQQHLVPVARQQGRNDATGRSGTDDQDFSFDDHVGG